MSDSDEFSIKARNMSFVAAVCVAIIHAGGGGMGAVSARLLNQFLSWGLCTFAVPWFFFASGVFLGRHVDEPGWWRRALCTRLRSLVLPYLFWCSAYGLAAYCVGGAEWPANALVRLYGLDPLEHPLLVPFWYVRALMILVICSPLLVGSLRRWSWWAIVPLVPVYVYCCGLHNRYAQPWFLFYSLLSLAGWVYFTLGLKVGMSRPRLAIRGGAVHWLVTGGVIVAGRLCQVQGNGVVADCLWLVGIPLLLVGVWGLVPARPWPVWLTSAAFPLYALHYFVLLGLKATFLPQEHSAWWAYPLRMLLAVILPIGFGAGLRRGSAAASRWIFGGR